MAVEGEGDDIILTYTKKWVNQVGLLPVTDNRRTFFKKSVPDVIVKNENVLSIGLYSHDIE